MNLQKREDFYKENFHKFLSTEKEKVEDFIENLSGKINEQILKLREALLAKLDKYTDVFNKNYNQFNNKIKEFES